MIIFLHLIQREKTISQTSNLLHEIVRILKNGQNTAEFKEDFYEQNIFSTYTPIQNEEPIFSM